MYSATWLTSTTSDRSRVRISASIAFMSSATGSSNDDDDARLAGTRSGSSTAAWGWFKGDDSIGMATATGGKV